MKAAEQHDSQHQSRTKLLDAALYVIRAKGYSATRVDDICAAAGLTKGSFFHHFKSKEELALAAAEHFSSMADGLFATAPYRSLPNAVDRVLGYVEFRKAILLGDLSQFTCLLGTMVQEAYETYPKIREACDRYISSHAHMLETDIAEAMITRGVHAEWTAESLAFYTQAVLQGSFVLAKAQHSAQIAASCIDHLHRYLELLFAQPQSATPTQPNQESL
ncbi:MAG TPA: TetR/AcrR family transcriptional regulator [Terracidiphilus sp.]|nr:TetR/AcrR family transcriptional regulator [Terracidiphilus sp.]